MKVGDLIQHRTSKKSKKVALIIKEIGPFDKKPYFYYKILWSEEGTVTTAPLNILIKLWEVVGEI